MNSVFGKLMLASGMMVASWCAGDTASAQGVFEISSTTFKDGGMLPTKAANSKANAPTNANCVGENVSPQLSWVNPPAGNYLVRGRLDTKVSPDAPFTLT